MLGPRLDRVAGVAESRDRRLIAVKDDRDVTALHDGIGCERQMHLRGPELQCSIIRKFRTFALCSVSSGPNDRKEWGF